MCRGLRVGSVGAWAPPAQKQGGNFTRTRHFRSSAHAGGTCPATALPPHCRGTTQAVSELCSAMRRTLCSTIGGWPAAMLADTERARSAPIPTERRSIEAGPRCALFEGGCTLRDGLGRISPNWIASGDAKDGAACAGAVAASALDGHDFAARCKPSTGGSRLLGPLRFGGPKVHQLDVREVSFAGCGPPTRAVVVMGPPSVHRVGRSCVCKLARWLEQTGPLLRDMRTVSLRSSDLHALPDSLLRLGGVEVMDVSGALPPPPAADSEALRRLAAPRQETVCGMRRWAKRRRFPRWWSSASTKTRSPRRLSGRRTRNRHHACDGS